MPKETRKQHYLPFAYLNYFRVDANVLSRKKARIYRDDGTRVDLVKVGSQCYRNWFYRSANTRESESGFQLFERDWSTQVRNIRSGKREDAMVFAQMLLYHFRNTSIRHLSNMDRYDAVTKAVYIWIEQKVLALPKGVRFTDDPRHVTEFPWHVRLVRLKSPLLTSDNPSVMAVPPERKGYAPFFLPISPNELLDSALVSRASDCW